MRVPQSSDTLRFNSDDSSDCTTQPPPVRLDRRVTRALLALAAALALAACSPPSADNRSSGSPTFSADASPTLATTPTPTPTPTPSPTASTPQPEPSAETGQPTIKVVAVGDISCAPKDRDKYPCRDAETAELAASLDPDLVLTLGDLQYEKGKYSDFLSSYDQSWGQLREITRPVIGNHEYDGPNADGYYKYFADQQPGPPGYYDFAAGSWRVFVLNSNCDKIDCASQLSWLRQRISSAEARCSLVAWHHPVFNSGIHGSQESMLPAWRVAAEGGADVLLVGHEHAYERFAPMDATGNISPLGLTSFTVGTGGKNLYALKARQSASRFWYNQGYGVLDLQLKPRSLRWAYVTVAGKTLDSGTQKCR
ncbi:MAG: metallophosphoesterase [Nocardioides sp.]